ncbi:MAG: ECF transporter S component [Eubacterium sp.]|jgi:uncharacterized membrane protein|nr:ECF transporter S component [Eubacterium sp.]MCH4046903.1 ECF transporter S component [Eubacterium sp.]MCH4080000.1 ECF transporter S component [Eubacterium sp.]MCH4109958.1 ECF transporter S component [Eubacterium sp.]MCI1307528.1 ECF transporter S component [Eubacterium sp.]
MTTEKTKKITMTALMAALVFACTFAVRIPNPMTGGYSHLGDCMIFLAVIILGRKYGAFAAAIGGALSDTLAGAAVWILPTFCIKFIMAFIMGSVILALHERKHAALLGAVLGGIFQIAAYTLAKVVLIGWKVAILSVPNVSIQTAVGVVLFVVLSKLLAKPITRVTFVRKEGSRG